MREQLQSFLEHLRYNRNASPHTVAAYRSDLSQLMAFLDRRAAPRAAGLADLDHRSIRAFLGELYERGDTGASTARRLAAIRSFGRYLRRAGYVEQDPGAPLQAPRVERKMPAHLDEAAMRHLLDAPDPATPLGRRDRAILELFYATGLRLSELVSLDLEQVNLRGRLLRVRGKGGKERLLPFNRTAAEAIRRHLPDRRELLAPAQPARPRGRPVDGRPRCVVPQLPRRPPLGAQRRPPRAAPRRRVERQDRHQPARAAPFLRDAPAGARRRPARDPGAARATHASAPPSATPTSTPPSSRASTRNSTPGRRVPVGVISCLEPLLPAAPARRPRTAGLPTGSSGCRPPT